MATSGSTDYAMSARDLITAALRKLNVLAAGETPDAADADDALRELNLMLKGWQRYENLWRLTEAAQTLVANTANYTLTTKPYKIVSARYRDTGSRDIPMKRLTREDYFDLPLKSSTGVPTQFYFDRQRDTGVLYVWPVPASVTTESIQYTYFRRFEDVDTLNEDVDIRQEYFEVVVYNLAARLADDQAMTGERVNRIIARAQALLDQALDDDREEMVRFTIGHDGP